MAAAQDLLYLAAVVVGSGVLEAQLHWAHEGVADGATRFPRRRAFRPRPAVRDGPALPARRTFLDAATPPPPPGLHHLEVFEAAGGVDHLRCALCRRVATVRAHWGVLAYSPCRGVRGVGPPPGPLSWGRECHVLRPTRDRRVVCRRCGLSTAGSRASQWARRVCVARRLLVDGNPTVFDWGAHLAVCLGWAPGAPPDVPAPSILQLLRPALAGAAEGVVRPAALAASHPVLELARGRAVSGTWRRQGPRFRPLPSLASGPPPAPPLPSGLHRFFPPRAPALPSPAVEPARPAVLAASPALSSRWLAALAAPPRLPAPLLSRGGLVRRRESSLARSPPAVRADKRCRRDSSAGSCVAPSAGIAALAALPPACAALVALGGEEVEPPPRHAVSVRRDGSLPPLGPSGAGAGVRAALCVSPPVLPPPSLSSVVSWPSPSVGSLPSSPSPLAPSRLPAALAAPRRQHGLPRGARRPSAGAGVEPLRRRLSSGLARAEPRALVPPASRLLLPSPVSAAFSPLAAPALPALSPAPALPAVFAAASPAVLPAVCAAALPAAPSAPPAAAVRAAPLPAALAAPPRAPRAPRGTKRPPSGVEVEPPRRRLSPRPGHLTHVSERAGGQVPSPLSLPAPDHRAVAGEADGFRAIGPCGSVGPSPGGRRTFEAAPRTAAPLCLGRVAGAGGGAAPGSAPSGRSRSARRAPCRARLPALPGAFGPGQVHSLFCVAASMVCLACGRVFTAEAARGPSGVPCSWAPFLPSAALFLLRSEGSARLLGALPDGPIRRAADRRGLLNRPREPD